MMNDTFGKGIVMGLKRSAWTLFPLFVNVAGTTALLLAAIDRAVHHQELSWFLFGMGICFGLIGSIQYFLIWRKERKEERAAGQNEENRNRPVE